MDESIGYLIKIRRIKMRLSNRELSALSQVSRGYISELEEDKYDNPSLKVICSLAKALNCTPNDLIPKNMYT
ncbi:helix-turn-helix transcriptional regulator [uncultured Clostridium sp.]|uniref:helix-turn-helix transcriptional regulator n=1 Tax=uncultured Clostridium sp. TaxID=59620 RepID=UPI00262510A5|nr:helix-turn-helix transcriptional regulator [uncultured Clostridium sp.]